MALESVDIALGMIAGHLLGDFFFQTDLMVKNKSQFGVLAVHATIVAAVSYLICGSWLTWQVPLGVFISHVVIDGVKVLSEKDSPKVFLYDQIAHFIVLVSVAVYWVPGDAVVYWTRFIPFYSKALLLFSGAILCVSVGGYWVGKSVAPFQGNLGSDSAGLPNAGRLIGQLERALIYLLVIVGESQGVGFLVTAKSILRFGEIKEVGQKKEAEYIIIGTLMSFGWALFVAFAVRLLVVHI